MSDIDPSGYLLNLYRQEAMDARAKQQRFADELVALKKHQTTEGFKEYKDGDLKWVAETRNGFWRVTSTKAVEFDGPMLVEIECKASVDYHCIKWNPTGNYRVIGPAPVPEPKSAPVKRSWWRRIFRRIEPIPSARLLEKGNP